MSTSIVRSVLVLSLHVLAVHGMAQGFQAAPVQWGLPDGGFQNTSGTVTGFPAVAGSDAYLGAVGSQDWTILDMNGDGRPDLVVTAQHNLNDQVQEFSPASNSYWKVYLNSGSGFSTTATNWGLPDGGSVDNANVIKGFNAAAGSLAYLGAVGAQDWATMDMNGDARPDLVVPAQHNANDHVQEFSPNSNSYWKVYLNSGSGFSTTASTWALPDGGYVDNANVTMGFNATAGSDAYIGAVGAQDWTTLDIDGDARPDLVVPAQHNANDYVQEFSPNSNSYWKVYLNSGSGFSTTATNWSLPDGGYLSTSGTVVGFNAVAGSNAYLGAVGSQDWTTADMNGDARLDLVVPAQHNANNYVQEFSPNSNSYWKVYLAPSSATWIADAAAGTDGVMLYPNPADERTSLQMPPLNGAGTLRITTADGRLVREVPVPANAAVLPIDLHDLRDGLYMLELQRGGVRNVERLVVGH